MNTAKETTLAVRAAVSNAPGAALEHTDLQLGLPREDEILVRIEAVGVCHTDAVVHQGALPTPFPIVLGHEGVGIVEAVGGLVGGLQIGDRVVMSYVACNRCRRCERGKPAQCQDFFPLNFGGGRADGSTALSRAGSVVHSHFFGQSAFATHAVCPGNSVVKVPTSLPPQLLAPLGCSALTGAGSIFNTFDVRPGDSVAVIGAGAVGLAAVMAAVAAYADVVVVADLNDSRLATASRLGATHTMTGSQLNNLATHLRRTTGKGIDFILVTTGNMAVIRGAVEALAPGGMCGVVGGAPSAEAEVSVNYRDFLLGAKQVVGVIEGDARPADLIPRLVDLHQAGQFPLEQIVTTFEFDELAAAFDASAAGSAIKPVVTMPD